MYGIRLEVSVRAPNLEQAFQAARQSRLLVATFLLSEEAGHLQLNTHTFTKDAMLNDVDTLTKTADANRIFVGNNTGPSTMLQREVITDLCIMP
jgi:hypothetical protein